MKRFLKLHKYRNFGMDKEDVLILNRDLSKDRIGDLVILIGPNNSGKSNVLDALDLKKGKLSERDKTTLSFDSYDLCPKVTFGLSDGTAHLSYELTLSGAKCQVKLPETEPYQFNYEEALREFESWAAIFRKRFGDDSVASECLAAARSDQCKTEVEFYSNMNRFLDHERNRCESRRAYYYATTGRQTRNQYDAAVNEILNSGSKLASFVFGKKKDDELSKADDYMKTKYGIPFVPSVIAYTDKSINQSDLETSIDKLDQSPFFQSFSRRLALSQASSRTGIPNTSSSTIRQALAKSRGR